jgi:hypothetical protein
MGDQRPLSSLEHSTNITEKNLFTDVTIPNKDGLVTSPLGRRTGWPMGEPSFATKAVVTLNRPTQVDILSPQAKDFVPINTLHAIALRKSLSWILHSEMDKSRKASDSAHGAD